MKDPELMMYRAAIGQILADAGINRETIKDMILETIDEKVEKQMTNVIQKACGGYKFQEEVRRQLGYAVTDKVKDAASMIRIRALVDLGTYTDQELRDELERREAERAPAEEIKV